MLGMTVNAMIRLWGRMGVVTSTATDADVCEKNIIWPFEEVYCSTKRLARWLGHHQMARRTPR